MPPAIGTGAPSPVEPYPDPAVARALAAYERAIEAAHRTPWRAPAAVRIEVERLDAAAEGRDPAAWALTEDERDERAFAATFDTPERRAAAWADAAAYQRALVEARRDGRLEDAERSLDTWEHLNTSNSGPGPLPRPPARAIVDSGPLGQPSPRAAADATARARVERYDRAKGELVPAIRAAADALAVADPGAPGPAILAGCGVGCDLDHPVRPDGRATHWRGMAERVEACRDVRAFRDAGCGAVFARPFSCDVRLCPDCERSRSAAYVRRVDGLAAAMRRPLFGTATIPNVPPGMLGLGVDVLLDAWARIRRTALFVGGPCRRAHQDPDERPDAAGELPPARARCRHAPHRTAATRACRSCGRRKASHKKSGCAFTPRDCGCARCMAGGRGCRRCGHRPVAGGVASIEVTLSERGDWHPHLHFVADSPYLPWREFRDAWRAATCDATRAAIERGGWSGRSAGYKAPARRARVALPRCRHLADAQGRPADLACAAGHGWRDRDAERCPYQDRTMDTPCGRPGEPIPEPDRCRGASMTWLQVPRAKDGSTAGQAAVREAIKYATKGLLAADGTLAPAVRDAPELLAELLLTLRNRRLVTGWGTFHGATDDPEDADAPDTVAVDVGELWPMRLPRLCPRCGAEALWSHVGIRRRVDCRPAADGRLYWHPPPPDHPPAAEVRTDGRPA